MAAERREQATARIFQSRTTRKNRSMLPRCGSVNRRQIATSSLQEDATAAFDQPAWKTAQREGAAKLWQDALRREEHFCDGLLVKQESVWRLCELGETRVLQPQNSL